MTVKKISKPIKLKLKKGDPVVVTTGKYKGKQGIVLKVLPQASSLVVQGINLVKKRIRPTRDNPEPQLLAVEKPIEYSNVAYLDPKINMPTKIGYKYIDNKKVRYAKKSGEILYSN